MEEGLSKECGTMLNSSILWDFDDSDGDLDSKPSELFGKFTWKIEIFPQINKRELRSNTFEVGGHNWYILIYPQGCDVSNHLSIFLCVANHDKLLPGWSHLAKFTVAVVNKEPKKSKYSDTLHRFWKQEHDWGWKKFMEHAKVPDGYIFEGTLLIKCQVQVIRFCSFWSGLDQNARRCMSSEKTEAILTSVVKHFFVVKEVTSTMVMDSLCSGLKALEFESKNIKVGARPSDMEESPSHMVRVEDDMFVLIDDVVTLLERFATSPSKDDKDSQNCIKDGGESFWDNIERHERRLAELGRRTIEFYVLAHIFSGSIEAAHQEAVLKMQEELIRKEEAENELKARLRAAENEKQSKKKK